MAAYASLVSLMQLIHDLEHHPSPPISLEKQLLDSITQRVAYFEEFLHAYNTHPHAVAENYEEEAADPLEMRIAVAAYAAEDAIESHIVDKIHLRRNNVYSKITRLRNCFRAPRELNLDRVIEEMDSIKKVVILKADAEKKKVPVVNDNVAMTYVPVSLTRSETSWGGFDGVLLEIMEKLVGGRSNRQVIPIMGMGGIGKTFLAKAIYADQRVKEHFSICAWATISQQYSTEEILCELLSESTCKDKEQLSGKSEDVLGSELHKKIFGRRFLIVMDDIWSIDAWDKLQRFFPNNNNGSRVLVTTRLSQLCSQFNNDYNFRMSFLDETSSWDLFSKTVFGDKSCPPELKEVGEKIVEKCRGLPLSIVVVGGLLKKMDDTRASWESIQGNLTSVVSMENDKHCLGLLKKSYNYLPVYLKPCFLHMGVFEEDEEINVSMLVKLWVVEGLLKPRNDETIETTARGFLQDLINRNLILIAKLGPSGRVKFCKMHDLVRDMCLKEGQKEGVYHVLWLCNLPPQGMNIQHRVVIPRKYSTKNVYGYLRSMSHTRSIICYDEFQIFQPSSNLKFLRTLVTLHPCVEFESSNDERYMNSLAFHHVNLRHLDINVSETFSSLDSASLLWNLHTLIITGSKRQICVDDFWKMPQIRHIEIVGSNMCLLDPPNCYGGDGDVGVIMENLHTLKGVYNLKCSEGVVKRIPNIKTLKMEYWGDDDYFVDNIKYLCRLESLSVYIRPVSLCNQLTFPQSLKKLSLWLHTGVKWEEVLLDSIGLLPLLEELKLCGGRFENGKLELVEGQFPCLKYLKLRSFYNFKHWTVAEEWSNILPRLEHLCCVGLEELKNIPFELGNINTLKEIQLNYCGQRVVKSAKEMFDEQVDLQGGEDELSFHVVVNVTKEQQHLLSLASPNFLVIPEVNSWK